MLTALVTVYLALDLFLSVDSVCQSDQRVSHVGLRSQHLNGPAVSSEVRSASNVPVCLHPKVCLVNVVLLWSQCNKGVWVVTLDTPYIVAANSMKIFDGW